MKVICLQEEAFYLLIDEVISRLKETRGEKPDKWINDQQAMQLMNIKSKTTMQRLRDEGKIRFSQPQKKNILYDRESILVYLEQHVKEIF